MWESPAQPTFTCLKSPTKAVEQCVKYVQSEQK